MLIRFFQFVRLCYGELRKYKDKGDLMLTNEAGWNLKQTYMELPSFFYTKTNPEQAQDPRLVVFNQQLAGELGLNANMLSSYEGVAILVGNNVPPQSTPLSQAYAGHQFGGFTLLGDGRAVLFGEQVTPNGERFDIQLKGSGRTPYSRGGDGRAALGPMLREYIISEAMHALGIPTTRGLAVVTTGEPIIREEILQGAILTRIASSHIRVGTFEYAAAWGSKEELIALADYTIARHDMELQESNNPYLGLLKNVIDRQAYLIAQWQLVGFIHGVMNTDNMTISGETIDYGPCAFMDTYHRATVFSSIDQEGRYAYGNQPYIGGWNLTRFAEALLPLIHENEDQSIELAQDALSNYNKHFQRYFEKGMRAKLGLFNEKDSDADLISELLSLLEKYEVDYTNTFIALTFNKIKESELGEKKDFIAWYERWLERLEQQKESIAKVQELMRNHNPAVIPRNHHVEVALEAAVKNANFDVMNKLLEVLSKPFAHTERQAKYAKVPDRKTPYQTFCGT